MDGEITSVYTTERGLGWKQNSDSGFTPENLIRVVDLAADEIGLPGEKSRLNILGLGTNIPTLEISLYQHLAGKRSGKTTLTCCDSAPIDLPSDITYLIHKDPNVNFVHSEAKKIRVPSLLHRFHILHDRKAVLWYAAYSSKLPSALEVLNLYQDLLADDGFVILDNIPGYYEWEGAFEHYAEQYGYRRAAEQFKDSDQLEPSTVDVVDRHLGQKFWDAAGQVFEIIDLGKGMERVRILKKRKSTKSIRLKD